MKRVKSKMMRVGGIVLTIAMMISMCGMPAVTAKAEETVGASCNHVCDENCGGMQAVSGSAVTACTHVHDETCGYAEEPAVAYEEIPDFSEAKVLTEENGTLYIDGVEKYSTMLEGNYKLGESITTNLALYTSVSVNLDLNGHTWNLSDKYLRISGTFSLYDTAASQTGKITSSAYCTIEVQSKGSSFNLYSGTVENTSENETARGVSCSWDGCNLYGGKIKSSAYAVEYLLGKEMIVNLDGTVLECGEGYEQISAWLSESFTPLAVIDVSDYTGTSLAVDAEINKAGKIKIFQGIQSAQDAERYTVNVRCGTDFFLEKEEYGMEAGEMYVYVSEPSFTQQPTKENAYMVRFNHPDATLQWYEYNVLASNTYSQFTSPETIASYEVKAGDVLFATVDADDFQLRLSVGEEHFQLDEYTKTASIAFASDTTINVVIDIASNASNLKLEHVRYTELAGENGVNLQNHECGTAYICKATVGGKVYYSDHVTTEHNGICTASGSVISKECSNCGKSGTLTVETEDGIYDGTTAYGATVEKTGILENEEVTVNYYQGDTLIGTDAPVGEGTYTAKITYEEVTASVEFTINHGDSDNNGYCDGCDAIYNGIGVHLAGYSVSLNGSIGVNFHMDLTQDVLEDNEAYMLFTLPNGTTQKVMVSDARAKEPAVIEGKTYYIFTCNVAAKEMTDTIQAQLITSDGSKTQVYEYSVREYADRILSGIYDDETKELVKAMLHYGAYSQEWFDYNTTNLANEGLDILDLSGADDWDEFNPSISNDDKVGSFTSAYLTLESDTAINLKFKLADGVSFEDLRVVVQDTMGNVVPATIDTTENVCLITLTGIKASDLDTTYSFYVTDKEGNGK